VIWDNSPPPALLNPAGKAMLPWIAQTLRAGRILRRSALYNERPGGALPEEGRTPGPFSHG